MLLVDSKEELHNTKNEFNSQVDKRKLKVNAGWRKVMMLGTERDVTDSEKSLSITKTNHPNCRK